MNVTDKAALVLQTNARRRSGNVLFRRKNTWTPITNDSDNTSTKSKSLEVVIYAALRGQFSITYQTSTISQGHLKFSITHLTLYHTSPPILQHIKHYKFPLLKITS